MTQTRRVAADLDTLDRALIEEIDQIVPPLQSTAHIPGLSLAVAHRGRIIIEAGFGHADIASQRPVTPDTVFRSGSMAKTYTATAVMQLVEQGRITLQTRASDVVGFDVVNPIDAEAVTVQQLLTHRAGLTPNGANSRLNRPLPLSEHLRALFSGGRHDHFQGILPLWSAPTDDVVQYSNSGMALLGLIVECANADGLSFGQYQLKHVIEPLAMRSTRYADGDFTDPQQVPQFIQDNYACGYSGFGASNLVTPEIWFNDFPAGMLLTVPGDHVRMLQAYLAGGELGGSRILQTETVADMLRPRVDFASSTMSGGGNVVRIGLAWMGGRHGAATEWFGHGGAHMYGFHNDYRAYPKLDLAVSVFGNRWDVPGILDLSARPHPSTVICEHLADWLVRNADGPSPGLTAGYRRAYLMGLTMGISTRGYLSTPGDFAPEYVAEATTQGEIDGAFDPAGFSAALEDLAGTDYSPTELERFFRSDRCRVPAAELERLWPTIGGGPQMPLPIPPAVRAALKQAAVTSSSDEEE